MKITRAAWDRYIQRLSALDEAAADLVLEWVVEHGYDNLRDLIDYSYAVATRYAEGAGAIASQMYDAIAELEGNELPPAEPAPTPERSEVAKTVNGVLKRSQNENVVAAAVGNLVKRTGADTMLKNAIRDGAEFAWIPNGDTCPFCQMLASNGWRKASTKAIEGDHAEHIHANCDCTYAIRTDSRTQIEGYDPDKILEQFEDMKEKSWTERINAMRRQDYAERKDEINAKKRAAYAKRKIVQMKMEKGVDVTKEYLDKAKPGNGEYTLEDGYTISDRIEHERKVETAKSMISEIGGRWILLKEINKEWPDYEWVHDGTREMWELKSITSEKAANSALKKGFRQVNNTGKAGGVILNSWGKKLDMEKLKDIIETRVNRYDDGVDADVLVLTNGKVVKALRYRKNR